MILAVLGDANSMKPFVRKWSGMWRVIDRGATFRIYTFLSWDAAIDWAVRYWGCRGDLDEPGR
jgi:hypothetical protein